MSDKDRLDILKTNLQKKMVKTFTFLLKSKIMCLTDSYIISNVFNKVHILSKENRFTLWMGKCWALVNKSSGVLTDHVLSVTAYNHSNSADIRDPVLCSQSRLASWWLTQRSSGLPFRIVKDLIYIAIKCIYIYIYIYIFKMLCY